MYLDIAAEEGLTDFILEYILGPFVPFMIGAVIIIGLILVFREVVRRF